MEKFEDIQKVETGAKLMMTASIEMQVKLIEESLKEDEDRTVQGLEWIRQNAGIFREAFNDLLNEDPDLISDWDPDESGKARPAEQIENTQERKKILKKIQEKMDELRADKLEKAA